MAEFNTGTQQKMGDMASTIRRLYEHELVSSEKKQENSKNGIVLTVSWAYFLLSLLIILLIIGIIITYNTLVTYKEQIKSDYGHIEAELQRRNNLYMNMVNLYMSYAELETKIFLDTAKLRNQTDSFKKALESAKNVPLNSSNKNIKAPLSDIDATLSRLMAVVEQYPKINADQPLSLVVNKLVETEDRIARSRATYNESVRIFNNMLNHFPYRYMAWFLGFKREPYYSATKEVRIVPKISSESPLLKIQK